MFELNALNRLNGASDITESHLDKMKVVALRWKKKVQLVFKTMNIIIALTIEG